MTTEDLFIQWWRESYSNTKPPSQVVMTHTAFADYFLAQQTKSLLEQVRSTTGGQTL